MRDLPLFKSNGNLGNNPFWPIGFHFLLAYLHALQAIWMQIFDPSEHFPVVYWNTLALLVYSYSCRFAVGSQQCDAWLHELDRN